MQGLAETVIELVHLRCHELFSLSVRAFQTTHRQQKKDTEKTL